MHSRKSKTGKLFVRILLVFVILVIALSALNYKLIIGIYHGMTLFEPEKLAENFCRADQRFRSRLVAAGGDVSAFTYDLQGLPEHYQYAGETKSITQFVEHTDTTGLIVTSGDVILYEEYFQGNAAMSRSIV
ncbi:MAG TPA: hypothetical protein DF292_00540 [Firmicutes bacterium]|jgi:hypothetical protein|nr:hypothetical protein [Bacillota bacterium]